jgi:hypothetical protein
MTLTRSSTSSPRLSACQRSLNRIAPLHASIVHYSPVSLYSHRMIPAIFETMSSKAGYIAKSYTTRLTSTPAKSGMILELHSVFAGIVVWFHAAANSLVSGSINSRHQSSPVKNAWQPRSQYTTCLGLKTVISDAYSVGASSLGFSQLL